MNELDINKLILKIPSRYLRFSNSGRLDFPGRLILCSGINSSPCFYCLHQALYVQRCRVSGKLEKIDDDIMESVCTRNKGEYPIIDYRTSSLIRYSVDSISEESYNETVLPIIKKLYIALIIEEEKSK